MADISPEDRAFSKLSIQNGFLTRDQVRDCFEHIRGLEPENGLSFEDVAVSKQFLSAEQATALALACRRFKKDNERRKWQVKGYEIYNKLGEGGLGVVYKAKQISMNRLVALKILHRRWLNDEEFKQRFLVEARLVGKLSHQNLIKVYDVGREDWKLYFSMEYIEGETLEQIIERDGPLDSVYAIDLTLQVLRAIRYISRFDIVHCDIKPSNVMMTTDGQAKLGDFGFVKANINITVEEEGSVLGTPDYISPEQAMGKDIDFRSDIYSLGVTLYHMLAKKPPFDGTVSTIMRAHIKQDLPDLKQINPKVPDVLLRIVNKMTAKNPDDRHESCEALFEELESARLQLKSGSGLEMERGELVEVIKLEQDKLRDRQQEVLELREQLKGMQAMFYGVCALAAVLLGLTIFLAVKAFGSGAA